MNVNAVCNVVPLGIGSRVPDVPYNVGESVAFYWLVMVDMCLEKHSLFFVIGVRVVVKEFALLSECDWEGRSGYERRAKAPPWRCTLKFYLAPRTTIHVIKKTTMILSQRQHGTNRAYLHNFIGSNYLR